jgi:PadR family transcriptional regulator PadR
MYHAVKGSRADAENDNWEAQIRKGWLELAVLATLWDEKRYGLEILRRLQEDSDLVVAEGTVYPILSRLKADGLIGSEWVESAGGPPRKYYWLTAAGRRRAAAMAGLASRFLKKLATLIKPLVPEEKKP